MTKQEDQALFLLTWFDDRVKVGNMLAAATGLRAGEILGLRMQDIGIDRLFIRHSFSTHDGLKTTKTGEVRALPLPRIIRKELLQLVSRNPHGTGPGMYVFWSISLPDKPMSINHLRDGLKRALLELKPEKDSAYWKNRNIVFHSWRHYFSSRLVDKIDKRTAMLATGHSTGAVFDAYANHKTEEQFKRLADTMGEILPFQERKII